MEYITHLTILFAIYSIFGISLNLLVGYTGVLSMAHAAFFGIGAYTVAILTVNYDMNFFVSIIISLFVVMTISLLAGVVFSKFKEDYYVLCTIGFNVIIYNALLNLHNITNGPMGIPGIPRPELFGITLVSNTSFLVLVLIFFALIFFASMYITKSPFCKVLMAIREDEKVIRVFGYNIKYFKLLIFVISTMFASIAGALFASYVTFIDPGIAIPFESIFILTIIIFGGLANIYGGVVGAFLLTLIPEALRFVGFPVGIEAHTRQFIFGLLLILIMFYRPQGIFGKYKL